MAKGLLHCIVGEKEALKNELFGIRNENARLRGEIEKLQSGLKIKTYIILPYA